MDTNWLFGNTISLLEKVLDFSSTRHNIIASNIANLDTPDYKSRDLLFKNRLREALAVDERSRNRIGLIRNGNKNGGLGSLQEVTPALVFESSFGSSKNGNTVDIDQEMKKLAENNLYYDTAIQLLARKLRIISESII